jgi:hypothetical protein
VAIEQEIKCGDSIVGNTAEGTRFDFNSGCGGASPINVKSVAYEFLGTGNTVTFDTCQNTNFDTKISAYSATDCGNLICEDGSDDDCGEQTSVEFETKVGVSYFIVVHGFGSVKGSFTLKVSCSS